MPVDSTEESVLLPDVRKKKMYSSSLNQGVGEGY